MSKISVLIEVPEVRDFAFARHRAAVSSTTEAVQQGESLVAQLAGYGLELNGAYAPTPMFTTPAEPTPPRALADFGAPTENDDLPSKSFVVMAEVEETRLAALQARSDIIVWPNSKITFFNSPAAEIKPPTGTRGPGALAARVDCHPHRPGVSIEVIRERLGVQRIWDDEFDGAGIIVGIVDNGVHGGEYRVLGGSSSIAGQLPGQAAITSHGSMCAAGVRVAAPAVAFHDYSFVWLANSGGVCQALHFVLSQRRNNGTPHLISNSYGFMERPDQFLFPRHEVWDNSHPANRKVGEIVSSGAPVFFAAGNCGADCPDDGCHSSSIGPGASIHAFNSLQEVITVAAVNSQHERLGYSAQGPGRFEPAKPDIAAYTHFFGNFGPGRPGGEDPLPFDSGTSAAAPVAAGVGALLMSAVAGLNPEQLKQALLNSATPVGAAGWNAETGFGVINAAAAYARLRG